MFEIYNYLYCLDKRFHILNINPNLFSIINLILNLLALLYFLFFYHSKNNKKIFILGVKLYIELISNICLNIIINILTYYSKFTKNINLKEKKVYFYKTNKILYKALDKENDKNTKRKSIRKFIINNYIEYCFNYYIILPKLYLIIGIITDIISFILLFKYKIFHFNILNVIHFFSIMLFIIYFFGIKFLFMSECFNKDKFRNKVINYNL